MVKRKVLTLVCALSVIGLMLGADLAHAKQLLPAKHDIQAAQQRREKRVSVKQRQEAAARLKASRLKALRQIQMAQQKGGVK